MSNVPKVIDAYSSELEVKEDEVEQYQFILTKLRDTWGIAAEVDEICKLSLTTAKVLEMRREMLFGKRDNKNVFGEDKPNYFTPSNRLN